MTRPRILVAEPRGFTTRAAEILRSAGELELRACDRDELERALGEYDVVWVRLAHRITAELLGPRPRCRILAVPVTGLDHVDLAACADRGIRVVSLRGETEFLRGVRATAEMTLALALALLRRIPEAAASVRRGVWDRDRFPGHELHGRTAGVVGVGRLGTLVAEMLGALGMSVLGYDPRPDVPEHLVERVATLEELLERSDLVTLHVSYSPATRHLIDAAALRRMRPGAVLINTSRGGVIDEQALLAALAGGRLGGAALDVLDGEPEIGPDHPVIQALEKYPNLLVVPHLGGNTIESFEKVEAFVAGRVVEALRGTST